MVTAGSPMGDTLITCLSTSAEGTPIELYAVPVYGHYTQLMWQETKKMGAVQARFNFIYFGEWAEIQTLIPPLV